MSDLRVELLVTDGCPHLEAARRDLEAVLRESIIETPIQVVIVSSLEDAEFLGFPGSPTIRVNGEDIDPQPDLPAGLACRVYRTPDGRLAGTPPIERIRERIDAFRKGRLAEFQREEAGRVAAFAAGASAEEAAAEQAPAVDRADGEQQDDRRP